MQSNDTQPLVEEPKLSFEEIHNQVMAIPPELMHLQIPHIHGPFTFLLNQNHNALRGCQSCGQTWVGVMAGQSEDDIRWHNVAEPPEEE